MAPKRVFLSYAREDVATAKRLQTDLTTAGLDVWFDQESLLPGQRWRKEIKAAIRSADYFVALLSPHSVNKRGVVQSELKDALDVARELPDDTVFIVPVRLAPVEPAHEMLRDLQWVNLYEGYEDGLRRLRLAFVSKPPAESETVEELTAIDLITIVGDVARNFASDTIAIYVVLSFHKVEGSKTILGLILRELISNAVSAAVPASGVIAPVTIVIKVQHGHAFIQVKNKPALVPRDIAEHVFKFGFTTKSTGRGIGLWWAKQAVLRLGGDLALVEDPAGAETIFELTLKLASTSQHADPERGLTRARS
jgi:signal transduction histidine kinase